MMFDWEASNSHVLINPACPEDQTQISRRILESSLPYKGHFWLTTSSSLKWVGLSKSAVLASAASVNFHLQSHGQDRWIHALPDFHVGGLGIWARAYLSGAYVYDFKQVSHHKWNVDAFYSYLREKKGTLTALVPTQLHDLIQQGLQAPPDLRAVIIGGGPLLSNLYQRAVALEWPICPSFGSTECASSIATAPLDSWKNQMQPSLKLLNHLQVQEKEGVLQFSGSSLFSTYAFINQEDVLFVDPKQQGWFISEDRGIVDGDVLKIIGRKDALVKIGGENVDVSRLDLHLQSLGLELSIPFEVTLIAATDLRLGHAVHLVTTGSFEDLQELLQAFQQSVLPFERVRQVYFLPSLPRSPLGKILKQELMASIRTAVCLKSCVYLHALR